MKSRLLDVIPNSVQRQRTDPKRPLSSQKTKSASNTSALELEIMRTNNETNTGRIYSVELRCRHLETIPVMPELKNIRNLDLSSNLLLSLEKIDQFKDIRELKVYDNKLTNLLGMQNCKELVVLQAQFNQISSLGENALNNCKKLHCLRLDNNLLTCGKYRDFVSCGATLTSLDLSYNRLDSAEFVTCLSNIEELFLSGNQLTAFPDLSRCRKLTEIRVDRNAIHDLQGVKGHPGLTTLDLANNKVTSLSGLGVLKNLEYLNVSQNSLDETSFCEISSIFPKLELLDISHNQFFDLISLLINLSHCTSLLELTLTHNKFPYTSGDTVIQYTASEIARQLPHLTMLDNMTVKQPTLTKQTGNAGSPMRPMSAAAGVSIRQLENQIKVMNQNTEEMFSRQQKHMEEIMARINGFAPPHSHSSPRQSSIAPSHPSQTNKSVIKTRLNEALVFGNETYRDQDPSS